MTCLECTDQSGFGRISVLCLSYHVQLLCTTIIYYCIMLVPKWRIMIDFLQIAGLETGRVLKCSLGKLAKFPAPVLRMLESSSTQENRLVRFLLYTLGVRL